jgi:hypothetical protein
MGAHERQRRRELASGGGGSSRAAAEGAHERRRQRRRDHTHAPSRRNRRRLGRQELPRAPPSRPGRRLGYGRWWSGASGLDLRREDLRGSEAAEMVGAGSRRGWWQAAQTWSRGGKQSLGSSPTTMPASSFFTTSPPAIFSDLHFAFSF